MIRLKALLITALALVIFVGQADAGVYDLVIEETIVNITGRERTAMAINGTVPGPLLRWRINVTNRLDAASSIHWHGAIVPYTMDGVPGISFDGIAPGEAFTYRFTVKQSGTYWYQARRNSRATTRR
jgi:L-ascorbate oxidase